MLAAEIRTSDGRILAVVAMPEHVFKTGSKGFYGIGKGMSPKGMSPKEGERLQISIDAVVIGSKPE